MSTVRDTRIDLDTTSQGATLAPRRRTRRPLARVTTVVAILVLATLLTTVAVKLGGGSGGSTGTDPAVEAGTTPTTGASATAGENAPTAGGETPGAAPEPRTSTVTKTSPFGTSFAYQPLWPFRSSDEAEAWQQAYRSGGHQPWHLDAAQTALTFAQGYLGYSEIDRTTSRSVDDAEAEIGVGYETEGGRTGTAAVVHLLRLGSGADAPWEVVGTADTDLTLTSPAYGANATSPVSAGGRITGVDESIRVQVRQPSSSEPLGERCCVAAGGERTPWQTTVSFRGASDPVLTIAASTGGHLKRVERFAVTAVRAS
jgi:hypothetical protein